MTDPYNAPSRVPEVSRRLITALRARGHHLTTDSTGALTHLDGIRVEIEICAVDSGYRWMATDRSHIVVGSLAWGRIWWATEPVTGWDYEMLAEQVEVFVGCRRAQLRREAGERRGRRIDPSTSLRASLRGASLAPDEPTPITQETLT